jgi:hypothetical protein
MKSTGGIVSARPGGNVSTTSFRPKKSKFPIHFPSPPKAMEYTSSAQSTLTSPKQKMLFMSMLRTFFERTMPP